MVSLTTFKAPLLRLILCGGGGLPGAWGPLLNLGYAAPWNPLRGEAVDPMFLTVRDPLAAPDLWSLPLDPASPWPARLASVAAWMLGLEPGVLARVYATRDQGLYFIASALLFSSREPLRCEWYAEYSWRPQCCERWRNSPLPRLTLDGLRLDLHPPVVALLLALYDVPEIRARVEAP